MYTTEYVVLEGSSRWRQVADFTLELSKHVSPKLSDCLDQMRSFVSTLSYYNPLL